MGNHLLKFAAARAGTSASMDRMFCHVDLHLALQTHCLKAS